jgi:hypothetical protein
MCGFPEDTPQYLQMKLNENRAGDCNWYSVLLELKLNEYLKPKDEICCSLLKNSNINSII